MKPVSRHSLLIRRMAALVALALCVLLLTFYFLRPVPQIAAKVEEEEHEGQVVELTEAQIAAANIVLATAVGGMLHDGLRLNGVIQANQEKLVQVTPRFPGIIRDIRKRVGDEVAKGDVMASVESNQSLTAYELRAPMTGTVTERQAALGEYVSEQKPVFTIADLSSVWIDFSVYRRDFARVQIGNAVLIDPEDGGEPISAKIGYISPVGASETQSVLARAMVPNSNKRLRPGLFVVGRAQLTAHSAKVVAKASALQTIENETVIFVREGEHFEVRKVAIGRRDEEQVEILSGLSVGEAYAAENSFILKAELAKGSASHGH